MKVAETIHAVFSVDGGITIEIDSKWSDDIDHDTWVVGATFELGALSAGDHTIQFGGIWDTRGGNGDNGFVAFDDIQIDYVQSQTSDATSIHILNGGADVDELWGSDGTDTLNGGDGGDTLHSGSTTDNDNTNVTTLTGGDGADDIYGSGGADNFKFDSNAIADSINNTFIDTLYNFTLESTIISISSASVFDDPVVTANDYFGLSTDVSSSYTVVGSFGDGVGYVYDLDGTYRYTLAGFDTIDPTSAAATEDRVAVDDNYAAVGDLTNNVVKVYGMSDGILDWTLAGNTVALGGNGNYVVTGDEGALEVYVWDLATGDKVYTLTGPGSSSGDWFGASLAVSGDYVVVGESKYNDGQMDEGRVMVYDLSEADAGGAPGNEDEINANVIILSNPRATPGSDNFGNGVAIDGNYVVAASYLYGAGVAYVFDLANGTGSETDVNASVITLTSPSPDAGDNFGRSVAMGGNYAVVGAHKDDSNSVNQDGVVYVFDVRDSSNVAYTISNPDSTDNGQFGFAVAMNDGNIVSSGRFNDVGAAQSGSAYIYTATYEATDSIDITDVLSGYNGTQDLSDYIRFVADAGDAKVEVDADGTGGYTQIALIVGVTTGLTDVDVSTLEWGTGVGGVILTGFDIAVADI